MSEYAIQVQNVEKMYKLYDKPTDRLKESLGFSKKKRYKEHFALNNVRFEGARPWESSEQMVPVSQQF